MKKLTLPIVLLLPLAAMAATETPDTARTKQLEEVVVEGDLTRTDARRTVYTPTTRQKNAAQTATDLLGRMSIPQIRIDNESTVLTAAGNPVAIYIDYLPATRQDIEGMRMADVRNVEYLDFPSDPRFQNNQHVVNFIMQRYEYGGYVKLYGLEQFIANNGRLNAFAKLQYKRMTYDLAAGGSYTNTPHTGSELTETFRLPRHHTPDKVFERLSETTSAKYKNNDYWTTFRALYSTDKVTMSNLLAADFDHTPVNRTSGRVSYIPAEFSENPYTSTSSNRVNSLTYSGYWNFSLPKGNSLNVSPYYSYSHTNSASDYTEQNVGQYLNGARDNSHQFKATLTYSHDFGRAGQLDIYGQAIVTANNTRYRGTSDVSDHARTYRFGPGAGYSISAGNFYGHAGFGLLYDRSSYEWADRSDKVKEHNSTPWFDLSLQYSFLRRHRISLEFHHMRSVPSSSYRSAAVVQSNPLFSYTGNPALVPYKSYDPGITYSFFPNNKYSIAVYAYGWIVDDRYVYDYEAHADGILRIIRQPVAGYAQGNFGVNLGTRQLGGKLQANVYLYEYAAHNGAPYSWTKSSFHYSVRVNYYAGAWNFGAQYRSAGAYADGCMVGTWMKSKDYYYLSAGWSNSAWNVRLTAHNFARWNWRGNHGIMHSAHYDYDQWEFGTGYHASIALSATYTFGYGKKIKQGNEAGQQSGVGSGILK